jgi:hypothetical protein
MKAASDIAMECVSAPRRPREDNPLKGRIEIR